METMSLLTFDNLTFDTVCKEFGNRLLPARYL